MNARHGFPPRRTALAPAVLLATLTLAVPFPTAAAVPPLMNYQGYLTDAGQTPTEGRFPMTFRIHADSAEGEALWTETHDAVEVVSGIFNVLLGSTSPLPASLFDGGRLWLETQVGAAVLEPRRPLVTVPYSFHARTADTAQVARTELWQTDGTNVYRTSGKVGIGTPMPAERLHVAGHVRASTSEPFAQVALYGSEGGEIFTPGHLRINPGGFVGIGTGNPAQALHVHRANTTAGLILEQGTPDTNLEPVLFFREAGSDKWALRLDTDDEDKFKLGIGDGPGVALTATQAGDLAVPTPGRGLILRATDGGNCWRLTVNNVGALATTLVPCP